jgi:transposase
MPKPTSPPRPDKRRFSAQDKLRILAAADACSSPEQLNALLRHERIYSAYLTKWRQTLQSKGKKGLSPSPGRKSVPVDRSKLARLERENARLERELVLARKLIDLQKKVSSLLEQMNQKPGNS